MTSDLAAIFKAYDIRGVVPDQLNARIAAATGAAFVAVLEAEGEVPGLVVGYDMRPSSSRPRRCFRARGGEPRR